MQIWITFAHINSAFFTLHYYTLALFFIPSAYSKYWYKISVKVKLLNYSYTKRFESTVENLSWGKLNGRKWETVAWKCSMKKMIRKIFSGHLFWRAPPGFRFYKVTLFMGSFINCVRKKFKILSYCNPQILLSSSFIIISFFIVIYYIVSLYPKTGTKWDKQPNISQWLFTEYLWRTASKILWTSKSTLSKLLPV